MLAFPPSELSDPNYCTAVWKAQSGEGATAQWEETQYIHELWNWIGEKFNKVVKERPEKTNKWREHLHTQKNQPINKVTFF